MRLLSKLQGNCSQTDDQPVDATVDNGHLVAWTAQYKVERIGAGGFLSGAHTDEGLVCRYVALAHGRGDVNANGRSVAALLVLELCTFRRGTRRR